MVGIPEIVPEGLDLENLSVEEMYHEDELIIDRTDTVSVNMITLRRELESCGEITVNRYHVKSDRGRIASITYIGCQEFFPEDPEYKKLIKMLKEKVL